MNELHDRVRAALHDAVAGVPFHPDERDVARRTTRRRQRRTAGRVGAAGVLLAAMVVGMVLTNRPLAERGVVERSATPTTAAPAAVPSTAVPDGCTVPTALPFAPTFLPEGWSAGPYQPDGLAVWSGPLVGQQMSAVIAGPQRGPTGRSAGPRSAGRGDHRARP